MLAMKRVSLWLLSALCGGAAILMVPTAAAADPVIIRVGTVAPEGTPWERQVSRTRKRLEKTTNGNMKLKVYLGGKKGDEKSLVRQVRDGRLELIGVSTGALATEVPALQALELPFLFASVEEADYVLDQLYGLVDSIIRKHGFVMAQWAENGWQNIGLKDGFVKGIKDLQGRKMRSQESPIHITAWQALGASPVEMSVSEVLPALKTGLVDGFAQTPLFTFAAGWHQGITHYTLTRHVYQPAILVYSKKWFDGLSAEDQKILLSDVEEETKKGRSDVRRIEPGLVQNFVAYGIKVYEPTEAERKSFAPVAEKVRKEFLKSTTADGKKLLKAVDEAIAAYRKGK